MNNYYLSIGLMSGTSMDGIDAALLETDGIHHVILKGAVCLPYAREFQILLKAAEYFVKEQAGKINKDATAFMQYFIEYLQKRLLLTEKEVVNLQQNCQAYLQKYALEELSLASIEQHSTYLHAFAVNKLLTQLKLTSSQIDLIGYHGQTLFHAPANKITVQLGDASRLAALTQIDVVNNFRQNDINHGGQGAPLAPLYHQTLAALSNVTPCVVVNCGGISNLTVITGSGPQEIMAYDAGPGNGLLDSFIRNRTEGKEMMDINGHYALAGKVNQELIKVLEAESCVRNGENFYQQLPPKSLDINDFKLPSIFTQVSLANGAATLTHFTAKCIVDSLALTKVSTPHYWILAGGGFHNPAIVAALNDLLRVKLSSAVKIFTAETVGWDINGLEAGIFAYLAVRSVKNLPLSLPTTTGVSKPVSGGDFVKWKIT